MWGGKWIAKKSIGSPSFEGLKGDFERLRKNIGKEDLERASAGAIVFFIPFILVKGDCFSQSSGDVVRK